MGDLSVFFKLPTFSVQDFQKATKNVTRIDTIAFAKQIYPFMKIGGKTHIMMERPMLNPRRFVGSISAARAHEAMLIVLDAIMGKFYPENYTFEFVDSKEWQKDQLPAGTKGSEQLKLRSMQYGCRLFPRHSELITKHKDADGLLMANYCRKKYS
jgi:hypothetical protein